MPKSAMFVNNYQKTTKNTFVFSNDESPVTSMYISKTVFTGFGTNNFVPKSVRVTLEWDDNDNEVNAEQ